MNPNRRAFLTNVSLSAGATVLTPLIPRLRAEGPDGKAAESGKTAPSWPMRFGPYGNDTQPSSDVPLVEDFSQAKLAWESEEKNLPMGKFSSQGANGFARPSGGMGSLILAEKTVYFAYMWPSGKRSVGSLKRPEENLIDADDVVLAVDAATGKTRWKRMMEGIGVYNKPTKRGGWGVTPAVGGGRVFTLGPGGMLSALSTEDGKILWQTPIEPLRANVLKLAKTAFEASKPPGFASMLSSLVYTDGILVAPTFTTPPGTGTNDIGLAGLDPATGKRLWTAPAVLGPNTTPALWKHEGKNYLLAGNALGEVRLIDPREGKVIWTKSGLGPQAEQLTPFGDLVLLNVEPTATQIKAQDKSTPVTKHYAAFRLTLEGVEEAWKTPNLAPFVDGLRGDGAAFRRVLPAGEKVFVYQSVKGNGVVLAELESATGKELRRVEVTPGIWACIFSNLGRDRLLYIPDAEHAAPEFQLYSTAGDKITKLGKPLAPFAGVKDSGTTGYEVPHAYPILNGFLYLRTGTGVIKCYDLQRAVK